MAKEKSLISLKLRKIYKNANCAKLFEADFSFTSDFADDRLSASADKKPAIFMKMVKILALSLHPQRVRSHP